MVQYEDGDTEQYNKAELLALMQIYRDNCTEKEMKVQLYEV